MEDEVSDEAYYESAEHHLKNLLAVVHRDGGHHCEENGMEVSTKRAMEIVSYLRDEDLACLRKQVLAYQQDLAMCRRVFQWISKNTHGKGSFVALRAVLEMKQR
jgi:hypothetical protein